ncbi:rsbT antagonist protein RsbS [Thermosyntropha lipolytica DSM 11003]|uniref:RsbT antagonist protein RsbS n=1 Tax=Thermosyntropha lipolytica DSM 11003 TaxID=1123382 RepID=A0A1M5L910_9FIRM|nr:STAS domain-containing protein [Thermosyntropha lipolytica]SHG61425.1 rsbT antagonist protein RsbS [Thermosyntropha lipolytica DSM 11003]
MKDRVVTTIKLYNYLIVPVQIELDDSTVEAMQRQILSEIEEKAIEGVIIDVSLIDILDSYISYSLSETAIMAKMMGCDTVICGMQPHVALTLAQMGVNMRGIIFAQDLEDALSKLVKAREHS